MNRKLFWILALLLAWFGRDGARAQQRQPVTSIQPDCMIFFSISSASSGAQAAVDSVGTSGVCDNHSVGAYGWTVAYTSHGFSALSLSFQSAPDNAGGTAPGTWATVAVCGTSTCLGINPNTATTSAITTTTAIAPWFRVNLTSKTGTGGVKGIMYGYKYNITTAGGSGGGGGGTPCVTTPLSLQYNNGGAFGCESHSSYNAGTGILTFDATGPVIMHGNNAMGQAGTSTSTTGLNLVNNAQSDLSYLIGATFEVDATLADSPTLPFLVAISPVANNQGSGTMSNASAMNGDVINSGPGAITNAFVMSFGVQNTGLGTIGTGINIHVESALNSGGGTFTNNYGMKIENQTAGTNNWSIRTGTGLLQWGDVEQSASVAFAALPASPANGMHLYCSDCTVTSSIDATCANTGTGAAVQRINGKWICEPA